MDTEAIDLNTMLPNTPILSSEDCEMIEGPLAYAEAVAVLRTMKIYLIRVQDQIFFPLNFINSLFLL